MQIANRGVRLSDDDKLIDILSSTRLSEERKAYRIASILDPIREEIALNAGSREGIDALLQYLLATDWDAWYNKVSEEERAREARAQAVEEKRQQDYLNELLCCSRCQNSFPRKETKYPEMSSWRPFCIPCFETLLQGQGLDCLVCKKRFLPLEPLKPGMTACLECRNGSFNEFKRVMYQLARAKKQHALATLTLVEWVATLEHFNYSCSYCGGSFEAMDHYMPLPHAGTIASNCVPACNKCNLKKSKRMPDQLDALFPTENLARIREWLAAQVAV